ncbi:hypothetical protein SULI_11530 [Saccharolobus solfataricus]|uniref:Second ORF in partial transposon ISC1160 n=2 Tax=Saccharolobus solfataricus TaxID=2287 RepID=Q97YN0_SACS2|nr:Second ORF in partial transposon ISC1160 [Saccharolobus solfataricus P2]AYN75613.1 hypothetical protein SULB_03535 [Saccharolobus solfataricus]AYN75775.1 hypothetical protein SULC_03525 [Saccharolobus solfataricus]AYP18610.1 hypothetical protein SULA_03535 [Saccharolobus solfataricus]AZF68933.1 hypothetical protein SULG_11530 [Saccharolobus solfataricus]
MTKDIVKIFVEQVSGNFNISITLDAGFNSIDVLNFILQFKYIIAVPVGDVKIYELMGNTRRTLRGTRRMNK